MARKLNKNLVGALVLLGMLLMTVTGVVLLANLPGQDPTKYAADAQELKKKGEYDQAMQTFARAFQKDPAENPKYLVDAADCAIEMGDVAKARQFIGTAKVKDARYKPAIELGLKLELEIAKLYGNVTQWSRVLDLAKEMLSFDENKESALAHQALGQAYIALRGEDESNEKKGLAALRRAHELDPGNVDVIEALAEELWRSARAKKNAGQSDEADALKKSRISLIETAIAACKGPEDAEKLADLKRIQARYMLADGSVKEGLAQLQTLSQAEKTGTKCHMLLGSLYLNGGILGIDRDLNKAEQYYKEALEIDPKKGRPYEALAQVYQLQRAAIKGPKAIEAKRQQERALYESGLKNVERSKHFRELRNNRSRVAFIQGLFMQDLRRADAEKDASRKAELMKAAEGWIEKLKDEVSGQSVEVRFLTARLLFARGQYVAATREAEAAKKLAHGQTNLPLERLLTDLYTRQGQWGAARESLLAAMKRSPGEPALYVAMGRILLREHRPADALRYLKPTRPQQLREALAKDPVAITLCIDAYRQLKQFELAEAESRRLGKNTPADELRAATILLWEDRYDEAEKKLKDVLKQQPDNQRAIRTMLSLYQKTNRLDEAKARVKSLLAKDPQNREYQRYNLVLMQGVGDKTRDELIRKFIEEEKDEFTRYLGLASFFNSKGDKEQTKAYLDKAEALKPDDAGVIEKQFGMALASHDWDRAAKYARKNGELNVDGTEGKIAEGRLALAKGGAQEADGHPKDAKALYEQAIDLMKVGLQKYRSYSLGWTYLSQAYLAAKRLGDAKQVLNRALEIDPTNGHAHRALARIAAQEGNEEAERQHLIAAQKSLPNDRWIKSRLQLYSEKDNPKEGIASREKIRKEKPDDVQNLVLLARLYADDRVGQYDKAIEVYRQAMKLSHNDLPLVREVAAFLASERVGRPSEGEALLKDLLRKEQDLPTKALIAASLGQFYEAQNHLATAGRHYRLAVSLDPSKQILAVVADFYSRTGRMKDALEYYQRTLRLAKDDPDLAHKTESRIIAILLAIGDLDRAKGLIAEFVKKYPDDPQGMIYEGAYHRIGGDVHKAKKAFDRYLEKNPDNATALWQRGQLFLLLGRWEKAIADLKKAKALKPDAFDYKHRISLADALIEAGRGDEAIDELRSILSDHPEQQAVAQALVDAYTRVRPTRYPDAENLIYRYMQRFPQDYQWPELLGKLGGLSKDHDKEIEGYEKAAELSQYRPRTLRLLFEAYKKADRAPMVIRYATEKLSSKILERDPKLLTILAWAYLKGGRKEECSQAFAQALSATGKDFALHASVVNDLVRILGPKSALQWAESAAKVDPDNVDTKRALVHLLRMNDKTDQAVAECDEILKLAARNEDTVFAHVAKGMLLSSASKFGQAAAEYEAALKLDADQPLALNNLAYTLCERLNKPAEALPYAKRASRLQPKDDNVIDTYGWTLALNGRLGEAVGTLLRALDLNRDNPDATYHLGVVLLKQKDYEEAKFRLERAKALAKAQDRADILPKITKALDSVKKAGG